MVRVLTLDDHGGGNGGSDRSGGRGGGGCHGPTVSGSGSGGVRLVGHLGQVTTLAVVGLVSSSSSGGGGGGGAVSGIVSGSVDGTVRVWSSGGGSGDGGALGMGHTMGKHPWKDGGWRCVGCANAHGAGVAAMEAGRSTRCSAFNLKPLTPPP